jgi:hypothetical protein
MNIFLLYLVYLVLLKGTITAFAGLASLPVVQDALVFQYHVLTDKQLNEAVVITRSTARPQRAGPGPRIPPRHWTILSVVRWSGVGPVWTPVGAARGASANMMASRGAESKSAHGDGGKEKPRRSGGASQRVDSVARGDAGANLSRPVTVV